MAPPQRSREKELLVGERDNEKRLYDTYGSEADATGALCKFTVHSARRLFVLVEQLQGHNRPFLLPSSKTAEKYLASPPNRKKRHERTQLHPDS